jgi:hypothetical protein
MEIWHAAINDVTHSLEFAGLIGIGLSILALQDISLVTSFMLVSRFVYCSTLKMEEIYSSETLNLVDCMALCPRR